MREAARKLIFCVKGLKALLVGSGFPGDSSVFAVEDDLGLVVFHFDFTGDEAGGVDQDEALGIDFGSRGGAAVRPGGRRGFKLSHE